MLKDGHLLSIFVNQAFFRELCMEVRFRQHNYLLLEHTILGMFLCFQVLKVFMSCMFSCLCLFHDLGHQSNFPTVPQGMLCSHFTFNPITNIKPVQKQYQENNQVAATCYLNHSTTIKIYLLATNEIVQVQITLIFCAN